VLADHPLKNTAEVELICPRCGLSHDADGRAAAARDRHHYERRSEWKADTTRTPTRKTLLSGLMCSVATIACGDAVEPTRSL
jgi:hypothetical protein